MGITKKVDQEYLGEPKAGKEICRKPLMLSILPVELWMKEEMHLSLYLEAVCGLSGHPHNHGR
jgi:hypothetical protein